MAPEVVGTLFGIPITNTLITSWAVIVVLLVMGFFVGRGVKLIPGRFQLLLETLFSFVYDYIA